MITGSPSGGTRLWSDPLSWVGGVVPTVSDDVVLDASTGNLTIDAGATGKTLNMSLYLASLTGSNNVTLVIAGSITFGVGMTYVVATQSRAISMTASGTLTTAGKLLGNFTFNASGGTLTLGDDFNIIASKLVNFTITAGTVDLNGHLIKGNSATNRVLIQSGVIGTRANITVNSGSFTNADFVDIGLNTLTDLSAITGLSGDCGNNNNITFTTGLTDVVTCATTKNYSDSTIHSTGRVPLPQDNVGFGSMSAGTLTMDMPRIGKNIDFSGGTGGTVSFSSTSNNFFGNLVLGAALTYTGTQGLGALCRGAFSITANGKSLTQGLSVSAFGGTLTHADNFVTAGNYTLTYGSVIATGFNITCLNLSSNNTNTRSITGGAWKITETASSTVWNFGVGTGLTISGTPSIEIINASANGRTITGGNKAYGQLKYTVAGSTGQLLINASDSYTEVLFSDITNARTLAIAVGQTVTVADFNGVVGTASKLMTVKSSSAGVAANLVKTGGIVSTDYISFQDIHASGNSWYAGTNSVNVSGNTGITFTAPPPASTSDHMFGDEGLVA